MTQMFTIPANTLLLAGVIIVVATVGFVIYGFVKGWKNVLTDYDGKRDDVASDG